MRVAAPTALHKPTSVFCCVPVRAKVSDILNIVIKHIETLMCDYKPGKAHTLLADGEDFVKRSASMSYLKILKHSNLSSKYSAYARTHAE